jgi:hypothetical protein
MPSSFGGLNKAISVRVKDGEIKGAAGYDITTTSTAGSSDRHYSSVYKKEIHNASRVKGNKFAPTNYRSFVAKHDISGFSVTETIVKPLGNTTIKSSGRRRILIDSVMYTGTLISGGKPSPKVPQNLVNRVTTQALNNANDQHIDLATTLAESKKTVNEIASLVRQVALSYKHLRRGNWNAALRIITGSKVGKSVNKNPSSAWLRYQYGIMPIMRDVQGLIKLLDADFKKEGAHFVAKSSAVESAFLVPTFPPSHYKMWSEVKSLKYGATAKYYYRVDDTMLEMLSNLTTLQPLTVVWELLPYSFIVDWFFPIGSFLQATNATIGLTFSDGYIGRKSVYDNRTKFWPVTDNTSKSSLTGTAPESHIRNVCYMRTRIYSFPTAKLYVKSPFSGSHLISAIALLSNLRK